MIDNDGQFNLLQMLPVYLPKGVVVEEFVSTMMPWHAPSFLGLKGRLSADSNERVLVVASEWPNSWLRTVQRLSQEEQESFHAYRFRTDHTLATGEVPFVGVSKGNDPPDIVATTKDGPIGIECMTFSLGQRRRAQGLFRNIRQMVAANPDSFLHLAGSVVHMWFSDEDSVLTRPHSQNDRVSAEKLARALAQYRPNGEEMLRHRDEIPEQAPDFGFVTTEAGATFYSVPMAGAAPVSGLFSLLGFELSMSFSTLHSEKEEWRSLQEKIKRKDKPGNDWILISSGAVDPVGELHPAEDVLADFLLQNPQPVGPLEHIKRVTIHMWSTGLAVDIWPERRVLFGPLYSGSVPVHQPLTPGAHGAAGSPASPS